MTLLTVSYDLCPLKSKPVVDFRFPKVLKVLLFKVLLKQQQHVVFLKIKLKPIGQNADLSIRKNQQISTTQYFHGNDI